MVQPGIVLTHGVLIITELRQPLGDKVFQHLLGLLSGNRPAEII
jgi:hypothetical protein